jgi:putative ABC transport system permease protein
MDLALIGVGAFAFYQLRQRGSLVTDKLFGNLSADPLLLVTPTLFMLMMALLFLRLFPIALRLLSYASRGLNGATIPLGMARMVRSPLQYSRLILLLILATAVGMFAAGFGATLSRSYDDRAGYQGGADGRVDGIRVPGGLSNEQFVTQMGTLLGADKVSPVQRMNSSYVIDRVKTADIDLLGVQPDEFASVAYWRGDFGAGSLGGLLKKVVDPEAIKRPEPVAVPNGTRLIGAWVNMTLGPRDGSVTLRFMDAQGTP